MSSNTTKTSPSPEQLSDLELNAVNGGGGGTLKSVGETALFPSGTGGLDLASINIARGR